MGLRLGVRRCSSSQVTAGSACCTWINLSAAVILLWITVSARWNFAGATEAAPVEHCDDTGCTPTNAYAAWNDRSTCRAASVVYPTTETEILTAVASAAKAQQKIKVATSTGHSIPILACPGSPSGVILSTRKYTSVVNIDTANRTVTAQSGITLRALLDSIAKQGLALPVSPYWDGVTLN